MNLPALDRSHAFVAAAAAAFGAYLKPQLGRALRAFPDWLVTREKAKFEAAVAAGRIPAPAARLAVRLKRAVIVWADQELPDAVGPEKMAQAVLCLARLPFIGRLVAADPAGVERALQVEYDAMRAEIKKEDAAHQGDRPTP